MAGREVAAARAPASAAPSPALSPAGVWGAGCTPRAGQRCLLKLIHAGRIFPLVVFVLCSPCFLIPGPAPGGFSSYRQYPSPKDAAIFFHVESSACCIPQFKGHHQTHGEAEARLCRAQLICTHPLSSQHPCPRGVGALGPVTGGCWAVLHGSSNNWGTQFLLSSTSLMEIYIQKRAVRGCGWLTTKDQPVLPGEERLIPPIESIKRCQRAGRKGRKRQHLCAFQHIKMSPCLD